MEKLINAHIYLLLLAVAIPFLLILIGFIGVKFLQIISKKTIEEANKNNIKKGQ